MRKREIEIKQFEKDISQALSDLSLGNNLSWARKSKFSKVQKCAVLSDLASQKDLDWARKSNLMKVRRTMVRLDAERKLNIEWAKDDHSKPVRQRYDYYKNKKELVK